MNPRLTVLCLTKELEWEDAILAVRFAVCMSDRIQKYLFDWSGIERNFNFLNEWLEEELSNFGCLSVNYSLLQKMPVFLF